MNLQTDSLNAIAKALNKKGGRSRRSTEQLLKRDRGAGAGAEDGGKEGRGAEAGLPAEVVGAPLLVAAGRIVVIIGIAAALLRVIIGIVITAIVAVASIGIIISVVIGGPRSIVVSAEVGVVGNEADGCGDDSVEVGLRLCRAVADERAE